MHKPLTIVELSREAGLRLLAEHTIGRIAFTFRDRVDIEPISYVYADGWIYARTSPGTKLTVVSHHPFVAFEIDDIKSPTDWRSVVVHGTIYFINPERSDEDRAAHAEALGHLRSIDADILTEHDSTPHRVQLFRIYVDEVTARSARAL